MLARRQARRWSHARSLSQEGISTRANTWPSPVTGGGPQEPHHTPLLGLSVNERKIAAASAPAAPVFFFPFPAFSPTCPSDQFSNCAVPRCFSVAPSRSAGQLRCHTAPSDPEQIFFSGFRSETLAM